MSGFLGDKKSKTVHHLAFKQKECNIYYIEIKDRQYFSPDSLEQALELNFKQCVWCNKK